MSITLHWWIVPVILCIAGTIIGSRNTGSYDFFTPLLALAFWIFGLCVVIGHYL